MSVGRPTLYTDALCERLLTAMRAGLSVVRFCREEQISRKTFYEWVGKHPALSITFDKAKDECEGFWEKWLVENLDNKNVNSALVKLFFANRFNWHDKTDSKIEHSVMPHEDWVKLLK